LILKSKDGIPDPQFPPGIDLSAEARTARRRFYPATALFTAYAAAVTLPALYTHPRATIANFLLGVALWTGLEYLVHRFVLHGRFEDGEDALRHWMHSVFDPMHGDHHARPWDGMYINGHLSAVPFGLAFALLSWTAPYWTAPVVVAALLQSYVVEEWVHYSVHFCRFQSRYFQYMRRHHLYHHCPRGKELAFGLTNGIWDRISDTRIPAADRELLYRRAPRPGPQPASRDDDRSEVRPFSFPMFGPK
jgi:sterol desaturase/sphingolipid hydroxylase (fatty acid hydroxylase superfamily)